MTYLALATITTLLSCGSNIVDFEDSGLGECWAVATWEQIIRATAA